MLGSLIVKCSFPAQQVNRSSLLVTHPVWVAQKNWPGKPKLNTIIAVISVYASESNEELNNVDV